jgi:hypothetical protein
VVDVGGRAATPSRATIRARLDDRGVRGGYTLSFWVADAATGEGKEFWHNQKDDKDFTNVNAIQWADADHVIFQAEPQDWVRWYSVSVSSVATPRLPC